MSKSKIRYRLPPCPEYDIPGMQAWLEDMAAKGLHLSQDGFFWGFGMFEEGSPRAERFRLEATATNRGLFSAEYEPDQRALDLNAELGWTYRARRGQFHIYSTADPQAPELNTDPQVQAMNLKSLERYLRKSLLSILINFLFYRFLLHGDSLVSGMVHFGFFPYATILGVLTWFLLQDVLVIVRLARLRRQLQAGIPLPHRGGYQSGPWHLLGKWFFLGLLLLAVCSILGTIGTHITEEHVIALADYTAPFPFATVEDFYPDAQVTLTEGYGGSEVTCWSNSFAPENYDYREYAEVQLDGQTFDVVLYAEYFRTRGPWTAHRLARELYYQDGNGPIKGFLADLFSASKTEIHEISLPGADYAISYHQYDFMKEVIVQKGNIVAKFSLTVFDKGPTLTPEELAQTALDHLR